MSEVDIVVEGQCQTVFSLQRQQKSYQISEDDASFYTVEVFLETIPLMNEFVDLSTDDALFAFTLSY